MSSQKLSIFSQLKFLIWPPPFGVRSYVRVTRARWRFWQDYQHYCRLAPSNARPDPRFFFPRLDDNTGDTPVDASYFYQDAWAFEKISAHRPAQHIDVGSHHKLISLLAKIVPVTMVDLRPLSLPLEGLEFKQGSILEMPFRDGSQESVSSLCVVEHIGLGRYGDPLDPEGSSKAVAELKRIVRPGGDLYISVPLDDENRVYFNAHRAFTEEYLLNRLFPPFEVLERRYIYGTDYLEHPRAGFGTGCYHLRRPSSAPAN